MYNSTGIFVGPVTSAETAIYTGGKNKERKDGRREKNGRRINKS